MDDLEKRRAMAGATKEEIDALRKTALHKVRERIENQLTILSERISTEYDNSERIESFSCGMLNLTQSLQQLDELEFMRWVRAHNDDYRIGDRPPPKKLPEGDLN